MKHIGIGFLVFMLCACQPSPRNFYVDSISGEDSRTGTSPDEAWKSLDKLNEQNFAPGDTIFFKAGTEYMGQFRPKGSGTKDFPIVIDRFHDGEKPILHGEGQELYTLLLDGISYWEVNNLEITNRGLEAVPYRSGVWIRADNTGDRYHIHLKNLTVHDVNGTEKTGRPAGGGIFWQTRSDSVPTHLVGLLIERCFIFRCCPGGIAGVDEGEKAVGTDPMIVIRQNQLEQINGKAIYVAPAGRVRMEGNVIK